MTDNEIKKANESETLTSGEHHTLSEKIKAIYPHITVSGAVDKPCYNIDWYDIKTQTMYRGYSSYKLEFVREWLQEEFEVVDDDIDNLINRQNEEINRLEIELKAMRGAANSYKAENERLQELLKGWKTEAYKVADEYCEAVERVKTAKAEAVKEFAERLKDKFSCLEYVIKTNRKTMPVERVKAEVDAVLQNGCSNVIDKILKEMAGEG